MNEPDANRRSVIIIAVAVLIVGGGIAFLLLCDRDDQPVAADSDQQPADESSVSSFVEEITSDRQELDRTVWSDEVAAQNYEKPFIQLWDDLRESTDKIDVLATFPFQKLILNTPTSSEKLELDVESISFGEGNLEFDSGEWRQWLDKMKADGYQLVQSEWHHSRFEPDPSGPRSVVSMSLDVQNERTKRITA
jgi:hypothetical protein